MISKSGLFLLQALFLFAQCTFAQSSGFQELDEWTEIWKRGPQTFFGYPVNQQSEMRGFYEWYLSAGLEVVNLNNAGDPMTDKPWNMSSQAFERDAVQPLKFWWLIHKVGTEGWTEQAARLLECTFYLKKRLDDIGWPAWVNEYSNTVFFRRPSADIVSMYSLAQGYDEHFGGNLAHVVVMQHVTKEKIDVFIHALQAEANAVKSVHAHPADDTGEVKKVLSDSQILI